METKLKTEPVEPLMPSVLPQDIDGNRSPNMLSISRVILCETSRYYVFRNKTQNRATCRHNILYRLLIRKVLSTTQEQEYLYAHI